MLSRLLAKNTGPYHGHAADVRKGTVQSAQCRLYVQVVSKRFAVSRLHARVNYLRVADSAGAIRIVAVSV